MDLCRFVLFFCVSRTAAYRAQFNSLLPRQAEVHRVKQQSGKVITVDATKVRNVLCIFCFGRITFSGSQIMCHF